MGGVIEGGQTVSHAVDDAQAHVGEAHTGDILAQGHALAAVRIVVYGVPQVGGDEADGFQVEHIGHLPGALGDEALDGVGQGVHAGSGSQSGGHGGHHIRVHHGDLGDVVGVHADELTLLLHVGDDVVDGDLSGGAGGGGDGDGEDGVLLGGGDALPGSGRRQIQGY